MAQPLSPLAQALRARVAPTAPKRSLLSAGSPSAPSQSAFVQALAQATGLDPRVLNSQATVEGAYAPHGTGGYNFLNLQPKAPGVSYSGAPELPPSPGGFARFPTQEAALQETAYWLNQMPNYAPVRATAGKPVGQQLSAIAASPWDAGGYGSALSDTFKRLYGNSGSTGPAGAGPAAPPPTTPAGPPAGTSRIVAAANGVLGTPYSWGGGGPGGASYGFDQGAGTKGFDCSSLVQYSAAAAGIKLPRTTYEQIHVGTPVEQNQLQPGDRVYLEPTSKGPGHVVLYVGNGQVIEAPHTGAKVQFSNLADRVKQLGWVGARRDIQGAPATGVVTAAAGAVGAKALTQPKAGKPAAGRGPVAMSPGLKLALQLLGGKG